jgi:hypothetical protein
VRLNWLGAAAPIDSDTKTYVSEDFGFCQKWRDIGGKI